MEWIVKIEGKGNTRKQIRIEFKPLEEEIHFFGEYKINGKANIFSHEIHSGIEISLEQIQTDMEIVLSSMNKRLKEYKNLDKGFDVLKWIAFEEDED